VPIRILLQTTIPTTDNDWDIRRFSLLTNYLTSLKDDQGEPLCTVTARNREENDLGNDPVLSTISRSQFDQLWLFAVDVGNGLSAADCRAINAFHKTGGGLMITRDHMDLGSSVCSLGDVGAAHCFHSKNPEPQEERRCSDDCYTTTILWPNYHSGRNGDWQRITPTEPVHPLLKNPASSSGTIEYFPAHPHEGAVAVPEGITDARIVATGKSLVTGNSFNLAVAFDRRSSFGRAVAESTFHHFADYNWNTAMGCPDFVSEAPGDTLMTNSQAMDDVKAYMRNLVIWLAPAGG
jgi:hypothetical protein